MKMLTELKIVTQEGCLCENGTHMDHTGVCEASCLGPLLCVWSKESTASHITHTVQLFLNWCVKLFIFLVLQLLHLPLSMQVQRRTHSLVCVSQWNNVFLTRCLLSFKFSVCGCALGNSCLVLCQHQAQHG